MNPIGAAEAIVGADTGGGVDWRAAQAAARDLTTPGNLDRSEAVRDHYASSIRAAKREITAVSGIEFPVPETVTVLNRHHWIEQVASMLEAGFEPLATEQATLSTITGPLNTASVAGSMAYLSRRVLGQYDPRLFAEGADPRLYILHPNIAAGAAELSVPVDRFRRWIAFHEVTHAAEFGAAPWLRSYLQERVMEIVRALAAGSIPRETYAELNRVMAVVEGYAELLMDEAFDRPSADLRRKLDERRASGGLIDQLVSKILGLDVKRAQYERGRAFFETVVAERGIEAAAQVWTAPTQLPRTGELETPSRWLQRVSAGDGG